MVLSNQENSLLVVVGSTADTIKIKQKNNAELGILCRKIKWCEHTAQLQTHREYSPRGDKCEMNYGFERHASSYKVITKRRCRNFNKDLTTNTMVT